jgi:cytochrome o ubiquinol oxidase operon protein cyoD
MLTLGAYILVLQHVNGHHLFLTHRFLIGVILLFAMLQLIVQLVFFLHLGREKKPRWNLQVLMFAALVVTILVAGSIWIMSNLDYNMQLNNPKAKDGFIIKDEGF